MDSRKRRSESSEQDYPAISVILPTYNMAEYVEDAITSVLDGDFEDFELLIIDDGSTDNTRSVVEQFTRNENSKYDTRVQYYYQENAGKSAAINHVLSKVSGEYLAILDADDQFPRDGLTERYRPVQQDDQKPDLVIGGLEVFRTDRTLGRRRVSNFSGLNALRRRFLFSYRTPFHLNSCLFRYSLMREVGGFDPELRRAQDQDYSLRLLASAEKISLVDAAVYRYRKYRDTLNERIGYRMKNLRDRPQMISKHTKGIERIAAVGVAVILDLGKIIYEFAGEYHN